ncbi:manganese-dependent inorganic pyrophosphatase [Apibacter mensalis]|uniref:Probable manganese-dependent inorganic pyrophosphatase n=1 Tax=Apibacter mensalis TaxID=1586267 RepID=A0A0X3AP65_9FLAO|nr:manganese-dependent inorganic pyrophosphatase [Apibacter mensalis]CVK16033.1 manganese-dependent inorganic pyrophosphatase [Apibacter mensalis]
MNKILITGHQNPDTDTITSAISFSYLQNTLGKNTEAVALGTPNEETQFALDYFKIHAPRVISSASDETNEIILVDHNEFQQSVSDIEELTILAVIDHHRIANFHTSFPLYYRAEPVGCTQTIILKIYKENSIEIPPAIAGLMLSGIISDTLLFKSPTCTQDDINAAYELAKIAGIEVEKYGLDLLKAGTNLSNKSAEELISLDAKSFEVNGKKIRVAQVNTIDYDDVFLKKNSIETAISNQINQEGYDLFLLVVTNVLDSDSKILAKGNASQTAEKAFGVQLDNGEAFLKGVVSRKKQIIPQITEALS